MDEIKKGLTPAGIQVEEALQMGYDVAAFNLYYANLEDDVPMVEGEWTEWHRMIQARIGADDAEVIGEGVATEEADSLGLTGDDRDSHIASRIDELNEIPPSIVERRIRNDRGEVTSVEMGSNPELP